MEIKTDKPKDLFDNPKDLSDNPKDLSDNSKDSFEDFDIYVECRGVKVKTMSKYLSRLDLFRTQYETTKSVEFLLRDYSGSTFHKLLDYLRDNPFDDIYDNEKIPKSLISISNYLNIDCQNINNINKSPILINGIIDRWKTFPNNYSGIIDTKHSKIYFNFHKKYFQEEADKINVKFEFFNQKCRHLGIKYSKEKDEIKLGKNSSKYLDFCSACQIKMNKS